MQHEINKWNEGGTAGNFRLVAFVRGWIHATGLVQETKICIRDITSKVFLSYSFFSVQERVLPVPINVQCLAKYSESNEPPPLLQMQNFATTRATKTASFVAATAVPAYTHGSGSERPPLLVSKLQSFYFVFDRLLWCLPRKRASFLSRRYFRPRNMLFLETQIACIWVVRRWIRVQIFCQIENISLSPRSVWAATCIALHRK